MNQFQINNYKHGYSISTELMSSIDEGCLIEIARQRLATIDTKYVYHNISHTESVVHIVQDMSECLELTLFQRQCLTLAAWFHDVGFIEGAEDHEFRGALLLTELLYSQKAPLEMILAVSKAIMSTRLATPPISFLGELLTDADTYHLSDSNYPDYANLLKSELEQTSSEHVSTNEWTQRNITFFETHQYYSSYAKEYFEAGKMKNLGFLKSLHID